MFGFVSDNVENIMGKGENAGYQHFLRFPLCFPKTERKEERRKKVRKKGGREERKKERKTYGFD